jgi:hypothetical protein
VWPQTTGSLCGFGWHEIRNFSCILLEKPQLKHRLAEGYQRIHVPSLACVVMEMAEVPS